MYGDGARGPARAGAGVSGGLGQGLVKCVLYARLYVGRSATHHALTLGGYLVAHHVTLV